jgi:hypothetical protein
MDQDGLKAAYERFAELSKEDAQSLDALCHALTSELMRRQKDRPVIMANRVAAMLAMDAVEAWQAAEWQRD